MIELLVIPIGSLFMFTYFRRKQPTVYSSNCSQTEPGIWLPVISMDLDDLPYSPPQYNSDEDVIMSPVEIDSHQIMSYRDYCS